MIYAIHSAGDWFCKRCNLRHDTLYLVKKGETYCENCVPQRINSEAIWINQNRERIDNITQ